MYFLHAINSDRQTRLLNVLGQIAMILENKKSWLITEINMLRCTVSKKSKLAHSFVNCKWQSAQCQYVIKISMLGCTRF